MPNNRIEYCEMNSRKDLQFKLRINILRKDCDLWVPRTHLVPIEEISLLIPSLISKIQSNLIYLKF